jgi:hypothetical protein
MPLWRRPALLILATLLLATPASAQPRAPELRFETLGRVSATAPADAEHLRTIVRLVGLDHPGDPIRVVLASEETDIAQSTPAWIAGLAHGPSDSVLLFPSRAPRYPHDSLPAVLHHEIAHILIYRAARGRPVPRWFNEGLATLAERAWSFEDRRMLAWAMAARTPPRMHALEVRFQEGPDAAEQAYALSFAFVRSIVERHGIEAPAAILDQLARGTPFDTAFERVARESLDEAERRFHAEIGTWERWIPLLTSPFVLWIAVSVLALLAIVVSRVRRAERRRRWDEEEEPEAQIDDSTESWPD